MTHVKDSDFTDDSPGLSKAWGLMSKSTHTLMLAIVHPGH